MNLISRNTFNNEQDSLLWNRIAWRLLPFLFVLYIIAFLDRVNVGFAKLQMAADVGLSDMAYGFGAGVFFLGYCLCEIPSNLMLQRVGARYWITRIMITWGLLSMSMMFVQTPTSFYILRFLLGMAEAGFYPGVVLYMTYWFPSYARSQGMAWFNLGIAMAGVLGSPLSGWIMQTFAGVHGLAGWQWLFLLEGMPAVLLGIVVFFYLDDRPGNVHWLTPAQNARVVQHLAEQRQEHEAAGAGHNFRAAFVSKGLWCLIYVNFALLCGTYGVSFWLPQIVQSLGVKSLFHTGLIAAIPFAVASVVMVLVSRHSDRTRERRWHGTLCNLASALGLAIAAFFHDQPVLSLAGLSLAMSGGLAGFCVLWALPGVLLTGTAAAAGIALIATVGNLGGYASPFMMGWIKQSSGHLEYGLYVLAVMTLIGAWVMSRVKPTSAQTVVAMPQPSAI
ncbi:MULTISPECIES: MFS transporter [unclassified Pseudomonas]|uniref:MFS transporter n=1 Tax=unclassified Pseudomonas TaxID=196821 RepID=UPI0008866054|nr:MULTISPECIES: MFS transporter [unclassified Pseudomonas]SCY73438.1 Major Facilitator Superfamily protein [Pseudomonas sp. NFACC37-1]SFN93466.1 Major Facilitator Superfamily protein [Pseudomonas sp. NFACC24-1]